MVMGITTTGITTVMEAVLGRTDWRWEWDCWVMVSAITATGHPLIRPPMAIPLSATPPLTYIRPRPLCRLVRPYISSNGTVELVSGCFLLLTCHLICPTPMRRELK